MNKMMKMALNKLAKEESGQALILVIILLLVGSIIITPLLGFMSTGILAGQMLEERMDELYAADAGVEDAIWNLDDGLEVPAPLALTINDKTVNVTIDNVGAQAVYKIISIASDDGNSATTLEVYVRNANLLNNAITSRGEIVSPGLGYSTNGNVEENYDGYWPTTEELITFYMSQVDSMDPYDDNTWDLDNNLFIGPLYRDGNLNIKNSGTADALGTLNETIYVTGTLDIGLTNKDFILDLHGRTIFVEGNINIGGRTTITGSGAIIAVGNIDFSPNISSGEGNFIFVMSIAGTVFMHPIGDFYGSLAGDVEVQLQPGSTITWTPPPPGLNLPGAMEEAVWKILTWDISLQ